MANRKRTMVDELERTTIRTVAWRLLPLVFLLSTFSASSTGSISGLPHCR